MYLLARVYGDEELHRITSLLADKGVPTFVSAWSVWRWNRIGARLVWVCLDRQAADAKALLRDPNHVVSDPVDVEAFKREAQGVDIRQVKWGAVVLFVTLAAAAAWFCFSGVPVFRP